jgi:hypothetical protein
MNVRELMHLYAAYFAAATKRQDALCAKVDAFEHELLRRIRVLEAERDRLRDELAHEHDDD